MNYKNPQRYKNGDSFGCSVTGKVIRSNSYTVKMPQYGKYKLINY